jgi:hypothetical protein
VICSPHYNLTRKKREKDKAITGERNKLNLLDRELKYDSDEEKRFKTKYKLQERKI